MAMVGQEVKNGLMRHFLAQGLSGGCRGSGKCEIHIEMFFAHISTTWAENVSIWGLEQQGLLEHFLQGGLYILSV